LGIRDRGGFVKENKGGLRGGKNKKRVLEKARSKGLSIPQIKKKTGLDRGEEGITWKRSRS